MNVRLDEALGVSFRTKRLENGKFVGKALIRRANGPGKGSYEFDFSAVFETAQEAIDNARANLPAKIKAALRED